MSVLGGVVIVIWKRDRLTTERVVDDHKENKTKVEDIDMKE